MAFHRFDLNLPFQNNKKEALFELNKKSPKNSTTSDDGAIIPFDEELENYSFMNSGTFCFFIFS